MIEVYLFFAVFSVQIFGMSVLYPLRLSALMQRELKETSAERLAKLYPGVDVHRAHERFLKRYRTANAVVAVLGLSLLGWFISHMRRPDWDAGTVGGMIVIYFLLQHLPIVLVTWHTTRFKKLHRRSSPEGKRKAMLQRRGLFDFVSPIAVVLAALSYALFAALTFYVARDPFPGFAGPLVNIGIVTLVYMLGAIIIYRVLYGRNSDPFETHANRMLLMSAAVNAYVWMCIFIPIGFALSMALQSDLVPEAWGPFAGSAAFLLLMLISFGGLTGLPRQLELDGLGTGLDHLRTRS